MAKTKVKKDKHSLYVRTNGALFRPYESVHSYDHRAVTNGQTEFVESEEVKVHHHSGTNICTIRNNNNDEFWSGHGSYLDKKSHEVWQPKKEYTSEEKQQARNVIREHLFSSIRTVTRI